MSVAKFSVCQRHQLLYGEICPSCQVEAEKDLEIARLTKLITDTPYINPSGKIRGLLSCALNHGSWQPVVDAMTLLDACTEHDDKRLAEKDELISELQATIEQYRLELGI